MVKISTSRIIIVILIVIAAAYIFIPRAPPGPPLPPPEPTGSWEAAGYDNGGCVVIGSPVGRSMTGDGYWEQTIPTAIEAGSTVTFSYAWKKDHVAGVPTRQDIYVTIIKPDGTSVNIDNQSGEPPADNEWYVVSDIDVSSFFDQSGTYKIRLRYAYVTADNGNAQAFAWFDEVRLVSTGEPVLTASFQSDEAGWLFKGITAQLIVVQAVDANYLDIHRTVWDWSVQVISLTHDTLMTFDWDMGYQPLLAESWEVAEDGLSVDFYLRKDVKFHCGHPFNAEAVVYTIERAKEPWSKHADSLINVIGVEALDDYTVRVDLKTQDRFLFEWFATASSSIVCPRCAEEYGMDYGVSKFCGTGPFKVRDWVRGDIIILERNDAYTWGPERYQNRGPARLYAITFQVIPSDLSREHAIDTGEANLIIGFSPRPALMDKWEGDPNINVIVQPRSSMAYVGFNVCSLSPEIQQGLRSGRPCPPDHRKSPLNDDPEGKGLLVRKALMYATNREDILVYAWENKGGVAYGPLTTMIWGYNPEVEDMYQYDPDMARSLLAQAGYADGLELKILTTNYEPYVKTAEMLKEQWKDVGVDLEIEVRSFSDIETIIDRANHDMFIGGWTWTNADMLWWYFHTIRARPSPNRSWWGDAYSDAIIENTFLLDDDLAFQAIQEAQMLVMEDAAYLPIIERPLLLAHRVEVKYFHVHPLGNLCWKLLDIYVEK